MKCSLIPSIGSRTTILLIAAFFLLGQPDIEAGEAEGAQSPASAVSEGSFVPLFNGKDLDGWFSPDGKAIGYVARDGLLVCPASSGGRLFHREKFADFILRFEFKLEPGGNNGVAIRAPVEGRASYDGMEIQILDDDAEKYRNLRPTQYHGSIYDVAPARRGALKKAGEWNREEILCQGSMVRVTLNGQVIVDADLAKVTDPEVVKKHPGIRRKAGHIGFLGHGALVEFRNIEICDLNLNVPPEGFTALFNGRNLDGWKGLVANPPARAKMTPEELAKAQAAADKEMKKHWSVQDGIILFDGKGHNLCSLKDYGDFELYVDWRIPRAGDSGIYVRGSPQVQIWVHDFGSGGLYNNKKNQSKPLKNADHPPGIWNRFRIIMIGEKVTVFLNDELVVDKVPLENYWERNKPIYEKGSIELQSHGGPLSFRNIFVREIREEESLRGGDFKKNIK